MQKKKQSPAQGERGRLSTALTFSITQVQQPKTCVKEYHHTQQVETVEPARRHNLTNAPTTQEQHLSAGVQPPRVE